MTSGLNYMTKYSEKISLPRSSIRTWTVRILMFSILVDFCPRFLSLRFHFTFSEDCRKIQREIKHLSYLSDAKGTHSSALQCFHHKSFSLQTIGLITSRCSGNEPALLFRTLFGEHREDNGNRADTDNCIKLYSPFLVGSASRRKTT